MAYINKFVPFFVLLILLIYGLVLFIKSRHISSKSLKTGILLPLIFVIIGALWWLCSLIGLLDFGDFIFFHIVGISLIVSIISIIFSGLSLIKLEKKSLSIASIIYGAIIFLLWLVSILTFKGM